MQYSSINAKSSNFQNMLNSNNFDQRVLTKIALGVIFQLKWCMKNTVSIRNIMQINSGFETIFLGR